MRILEQDPQPIAELTFLNVGRGPGQYYEVILPVELAWVDQLPDGVAAIIVTSDLQAREGFKNETGPQLRLLGNSIPVHPLFDFLKVARSYGGGNQLLRIH